MDPLSTVRQRLVNQRLAGEPFSDAAEAVRWLGAVQAQEFAEAKWSLAERTNGCTDADVEAAFARGDIIRTHLLRPTWHFVAREDLRWMLRLSRPRVHALNRHWYGKFGASPELLIRSHEVFARTLAGDGPLTRRELVERLAQDGIETSGPQLAYFLMYAELEELICSGPRRGKQHTYALVDDRVPVTALDDRSRESALDELALRYFRSHGPATVRDFTTWSSFTVADTKAALQRLNGQLECINDEDGSSWYSVPAAGVVSPRLTGAFLISMFDETVVAYQDLRVVLAHEPSRPGLFLDRAIVIDGRTVGSWKRTINGRSAVVEATLFLALTRREEEALDQAVHRFGRFLEMEATVKLQLAPSVTPE
ncbi:winged helix DNA-binding domain-containing protein [Arthrobacter sp. R1-13]